MAVPITGEQELFAQEVFAEVTDLAADDLFTSEGFTGWVLAMLEEQGHWPDFQLAYHRRPGAGARAAVGLDAWGIDRTTAILYLAISDFHNGNDAQSLSRSDRDRTFKRLRSFVEAAGSGKIEVEEHNPVQDVAELIETGEDFDLVRCFLLSNQVTERTELPGVDGVSVSLHCWDLEAIRRLRESESQHEQINIDLVELFGDGLRSLSCRQMAEHIKTYLCTIPGEYLAELYLEYGPRLLERNVRAFLAARTKVNQGIRNTLRNEPERFLAYNNGLTATASAVSISETGDGPVIDNISDFQIVNGGQTTASIAAALKDPDVDLSKVSVQMKLAVVDEDHIDDLVTYISEYANSQNSVKVADLSSNHPYLREMMNLSRKVWTPTGAGNTTQWYFERARGSYNVDKGRAGNARAQKEFEGTRPKNQKITKDQLALYENTWACIPHVVCSGGQKNFGNFMESLAPRWNEGMETSELRKAFENLVAKALLFRATDKLVAKELGGTYKRQIVAYTLAYYIDARRKREQPVDLAMIWKTQKVDEETGTDLCHLAGQVKEQLIDSGSGRNITEWAKKDECWVQFRSKELRITAPKPLITSGGSTRLVPKKPPPRPVQKRGRPSMTGPGKTLVDATKDALGSGFTNPWNRSRQPVWHYVGQSDVPSPLGDRYHVFRGVRDLNTGRKVDYFLVDPKFGEIKDYNTLGPVKMKKFDEFLERQGLEKE